MQKNINRKDYYGGALMVLIGLGAIYGGTDYLLKLAPDLASVFTQYQTKPYTQRYFFVRFPP